MIILSEYNPLVSIIIPVFNGANFLREAIDSAISQTYSNIEIIVVNDGSTDNGETEKIALSYGDKIRYYKKENGGCASALNYGISKMQGEWFSWLSHDDVYFEDKVKSAIDVINKYNLSTSNTVIICENSAIDENGKEIICEKPNGNYVQISAEKMFEKFMKSRALNGCALLIPKNAIDKTGFFREDYVFILDWIYWVELALKGVEFFEYPQVLVKNRRHKGQVSVQKLHLLADEQNRYLMELSKKLKSKEQLILLWIHSKQLQKPEVSQAISKTIKIPLKAKIIGFIRCWLYRFRKLVVKILVLLGLK